MELAKSYDSLEAEPRLQKFWEDKKVYRFDRKTKRKIFSIDTPPPTMSGKMHLGHTFSYAQQDFIARYKRMRGYEVFYPFGTDDNGLPTEKLVQKERGVNASKMERYEFIKLCLAYLKENRPGFIQDWKELGMSCDFDLSYSTIDDSSRKISQRTFLELAKKDLVYRQEAPVIWDTTFQTAIAQAELVDLERKSTFNDIVFKTEDGKEIIIATTRPELLGACVAVFAHPDDERYKKLLGKTAITPLYNSKVPIIADERVSTDKGTGIVMCCTFGDQTDIEWYKHYKLPLKMVITRDGKMNEASGKYVGMRIEDAKKAIIQDLKDAGLLRAQTDIVQTVNIGERSGTPVEIINSKQWYIKYLDKREEFLKAATELNWYPDFMKHRLINWINGLNWDWSISRQRHYGIPIPVWYGDDGKVYFADEKQLPVDPVKDRPLGVPASVKLTPEQDVFDTWFTSASTPFLAVELIDDPSLRKKLFPMALRPQAHDIINFWLFYTMAKTRLLHGVNPWQDVTISGFVLDPKGQKMSKSKGNVIKPQDVIHKYGADATRFWAATSKLGEDLPYMEKDVFTGKKFVTKLWNASRFALMHLEDFDTKKPKLHLMDKWLLTKLSSLISSSTESFDGYEYVRTKADTEKFFWQDLCDNYLEISKGRLYGGDKAARASAQYALYHAVLTVLKLMAPITPFITEEIYQQYFAKREKHTSIHQSDWPDAKAFESDSNSLEVGEAFISILAAVRKHKSEKSMSLKTEVNSLVIECSPDIRKGLEESLFDLKESTRALEVKFSKANTEITEKIKIDILM